MLFRQLFDPETSTYTYLLADAKTREAVIIDSVISQHERDITLLNELGLTLKFAIDTHVHADHITGMGKLKQSTGCQLGMPNDPVIQGADLYLKEGDTLSFGQYTLHVITTPGHTSEHLAFRVNNFLFTGDALLIRGCGRTDFQHGDAKTLYKVITEKLFTLPENTFVYPGHDYRGHTVSTIAEEKAFNPRFQVKDVAAFEHLMANLNLPDPKKIKESVPANRQCGLIN